MAVLVVAFPCMNYSFEAVVVVAAAAGESMVVAVVVAVNIHHNSTLPVVVVVVVEESKVDTLRYYHLLEQLNMYLLVVEGEVVAVASVP